MFQLDLEKAEEPEIKLPTSVGSQKRQENSRKTSISALLITLKTLTVSGRSAGEGIGYPLQYSWASLVVQLVRIYLQCGRPGFNPWVRKIPWRREKLPTHSGILAWRISWTKSMGSQRIGPNWATFTFTLTVWITTNYEKFLKRWNTRPPNLPPEKSLFRSRSNS